MTIGQAITRTDRLCSNTFPRGQKKLWLAKLEAMLKLQLLDTHEEGLTYTPILEETPEETELMLPSPFDEVYIRYLQAQIDLYNGETERYNASVLLYNAEFDALERWYNRTWPPKGAGLWRT